MEGGQIMKNLSKIFSVVLIFAMAAFVYAGGAPDQGASGGPTVLTFWTFQELHSGFMLDAAENWNKLHPNEKIELKVDVLPYDEMHNKLLISLQAGTGAPDISDIEISRFANYIRGKNPGLAPLNDVLAADLEKLCAAEWITMQKTENSMVSTITLAHP